MAEGVCSDYVKIAGAKEGKEEGSKKQDFVAFQHQQCYSKEVGVSPSTWSFEDIG